MTSHPDRRPWSAVWASRVVGAPSSALRGRTAGLVLLAATLAACATPLGRSDTPADGGAAAPDAPSSAATGPGATVDDPVVVLVSVDGLSPQALGEADLSTGGFDRLRQEGASTYDARTAVELTVTLPNHTSMLTGRRIMGPSGTSVTMNEDVGSTLETLHGSYVPGLFDVAHDHGLTTGLYAQKPKFDLLVRSWDDTHGAEDVTGADDGRGKLDQAVVSSATTDLVDQVVSDVRDRGTDVAFLHLAGPDTAGHAHGWMSRPYLDAVAEADAQVGRLLSAIADDEDLSRRTSVVVTADHGGRGRGHSRARDAANFTIPFYAWGRDVGVGDLYALNPTRQDPGTDQIGYSGPQPIRNIDAANLTLRLLGLDPLPSYADGSLEVVRTR